MLLSDVDILRRIFVAEENPIRVSPVLDWNKQLQAASIDLRLGGDLILFRRELEGVRDIFDEEAEKVNARLSEKRILEPLQGFVIHPGDFVLATTFESVQLPADVAARLEGKSSWGRIGLQVHSTAGFIDPGFAGKVTVEISNVGKLPIKLYVGVLVAQLCFFELKNPAQRAYHRSVGGKYFGQLGTGASRYFDDSEVRVLGQHVRSEK